ncbi:MAG: tyrosine-protein phosphatase [Psychromonas sp.]
MSSHPFDALTLDNGAKLIFTPCPGIKDTSLTDSVVTLKQAGTEMLITLMFDKEMAKNNAQQLPNACAENKIAWVQLPIADDAAPNEVFKAAWDNNKSAILAVIEKQGSIAVHCKGGSGRTGLVIGLILLSYGLPVEQVISEVQKIRPKALKHPVQLDYFNSFL